MFGFTMNAIGSQVRSRCEDEVSPRADSTNWLIIRGAAHNNLRYIDVEIPLGRFVCVTGVSGSGKSSLVNDILYERLARDLNRAENTNPGRHRAIQGLQHLDKVIAIDQSPIGRTPRSNPATYVKVFDEIRDLFARLPDAQVRGYKPGRFSFNVKADGAPDSAASAGRCEACEGNGANRIEMDFLADVWVACPVCGGRRFSRETLQIHYKGRSIADVLEMDVQQALEHFANIPRIADMLRTLHDVGLDYIKLGQSSTTLSGGEAQRIKLARELVKRSTGRTLYILDEPTTGLHFEDIHRLLDVLHGFADAGNTVVVIEHNLDVIKTADWVIDLGPEGGESGGYLVAAGTPEEIAANERSFTGQALRPVLGGDHRTASSGQGKARRAKKPVETRRLPDATSVIRVEGARENNLKDVTCDVPRNAMTVFTGVSGSGKTSLAVDTIYVEGQRRYVESLSAYARQFLGQFRKPRVDRVSGLSPAIAIDQKSPSRTPRSTVGTVTEVYDYMRVLWARLGQPWCPACERPVGTQTSDEIVDALLALDHGSRWLLCAPLQRSPGESYDALWTRCRSAGYARVRIDGQVYPIDPPPAIDPRRTHSVEVVVDRILIRPKDRSRIADSVEHALAVGDGVVIAVPGGSDGGKECPAPEVAPASRSAGSAADSNGKPRRFSVHFACDECGRSFDEITPHHFSFNSRIGWCPTCEGLGVQRGTRTESIVLQPGASVLEGAITGWGRAADKPMLAAIITALARHIGFDPRRPWTGLDEAQRHALLFGTGDAWIDLGLPADRTGGADRAMRVQFKGFFPAIDEATRVSWQYRTRLETLVTEVPCQACAGSRLRREPAAVRLAGRTIVDVGRLPLAESLRFFERFTRDLNARSRTVGGELLHEIVSRLRFLVNVGLEYLTLDRAAPTLSGGESQRIRLAAQIGSGLTGVLYVLDEPTIGLHPRDNQRLVAALKRLRDLGNTLVVVEHDREVIGAADHLLDFGPGAGVDGGRVVAAGAPADVTAVPESLTGQYLSDRQTIPVPSARRMGRRETSADKKRRPAGKSGRQAAPERLIIVGARQNNLKNLTVEIPLGRFVAVTGVSGSGKSSLITDILCPALLRRIHHARVTVGEHEEIRGVDLIDKVIHVDQSPIGNSPLSNPCTYVGAFDLIRELFVRLPESRVRGYTANRFSFNRPGGRCEDCDGLGQVCYEMHFLPDVWITCETCGGARYNAETLQVRYQGHSIADILNLRVNQALELFIHQPRIRRLLETLDDVGLGYVALGQAAPTLSGGEAQRVKLAAELARPSTGRTLYVLDEPTTGLHFDDLRKLLGVLHRFVDRGNTVVVIEHNLDVIKTADWVIDLGPDAGDAGGRLVAAGTPEEIAARAASHTGRLLAEILNRARRVNKRESAKRSPARKSLESAPQSLSARHSTLDDFQSRSTAATPDAQSDATDPDARSWGRRLGVTSPADAAAPRMPWQRDGRRWHTRNRIGRNGEPVEWECAALEWIVDEIERLGGDALAPTDWNDRARVEIRTAGAARTPLPWFLHARTGGRWLLDLGFRVPARTFTAAGLVRTLALKPLDQVPGVPISGTPPPRIQIRRVSADTDEVRILLRGRAEASRPPFRAFLRTALRRYLAQVRALVRDDAIGRPWAADGRAWHLSQKSIRPSKPPQWQPALLLELIGAFRRIDSTLTPDWDRKSQVLLREPVGAAVARLATNEAEGIRVSLVVPAGRFTPTRIEALGLHPRLLMRKDRCEIEFRVQELSQVPPALFREVVRACSSSGHDAVNARAR